MIDLHTHVLPGIDDGARDLADSAAIARACVADGITAVAATPHVRSDYPNRPDAIEAAVAELREHLAREAVALRVYAGAEIALDSLHDLSDADLRRLALDGGAHVLLEFPYYGWPQALDAAVARLDSLGLRTILAHPERNPDVAAAPELLRPFVDAGALVQVTAISLVGGLGRSTRAAAHTLVRSELAHLVASDAHSPRVREAGLRAAARSLHDSALAQWLTLDVPGTIVAGARLPRRPRRSRLSRVLRR